MPLTSFGYRRQEITMPQTLQTLSTTCVCLGRERWTPQSLVDNPGRTESGHRSLSTFQRRPGDVVEPRRHCIWQTTTSTSKRNQTGCPSVHPLGLARIRNVEGDSSPAAITTNQTSTSAITCIRSRETRQRNNVLPPAVVPPSEHAEFRETDTARVRQRIRLPDRGGIHDDRHRSRPGRTTISQHQIACGEPNILCGPVFELLDAFRKVDQPFHFVLVGIGKDSETLLLASDLEGVSTLGRRFVDHFKRRVDGHHPIELQPVAAARGWPRVHKQVIEEDELSHHVLRATNFGQRPDPNQAPVQPPCQLAITMAKRNTEP